jgi:hypothetical protein
MWELLSSNLFSLVNRKLGKRWIERDRSAAAYNLKAIDFYSFGKGEGVGR